MLAHLVEVARRAGSLATVPIVAQDAFWFAFGAPKLAVEWTVLVYLS